VKSDSGQRDGQFQGRIMNTSKFPTATFELTEPIDLGRVPADGTTVTKDTTGKLTLHGTTKTVTFSGQARKTGAAIAVNGTIPIAFADYGIDNLSGGPATTLDNGSLEFLLNFAHA
jgi:polyisoprenoid-binding protein YceI